MKFPRLALLLLVTALAAWLAGALYTWLLDPEMKFWTAAAKQKLDWVEKMREKHGHVIGVVGGSTTTFGIDAQHIEREHGLPFANLGLHVGMGPEACIGFGLSALKEGDTMVLSLEPAALIEDYPEESKLGSKLALLLGLPEMTAWNAEHSHFEFVRSVALASPGGYHVMTMLGKLALGLPPYRYSIEKLQPGGLQVTDERRDFTVDLDFSSPEQVAPITARGVQLLKSAQSAANKKGIDLVYVLPWSYWPDESADRRRNANAALLNEIGKHTRVLREPPMGAHSELQDFTDSGQHITKQAATVRSVSLLDALKADPVTGPVVKQSAK